MIYDYDYCIDTCGLDKRLNITLGVVIGVLFIAFLLLPALSMNFSGSLKDYLGDLVYSAFVFTALYRSDCHQYCHSGKQRDSNNKTCDIRHIELPYSFDGGLCSIS